MNECCDCEKTKDGAFYCQECETLNADAARDNGRRYGAAIAFGLMGMAVAIRSRCTCRPGAQWEDLCEGCRGY